MIVGMDWNGHNGTFWGHGKVLYLDCGSGWYRDEYICLFLSLIYFLLSKSIGNICMGLFMDSILFCWPINFDISFPCLLSVILYSSGFPLCPGLILFFCFLLLVLCFYK